MMLGMVLCLILSTLLGGVVGYQREKADKPAGLRTHMLVSLGSCMFTAISVYDFQMDPARIAAGIVTGIGFIGAETILAETNRVVGITTAASLWVTASIGLAVGIGNYVLSGNNSSGIRSTHDRKNQKDQITRILGWSASFWYDPYLRFNPLLKDYWAL